MDTKNTKLSKSKSTRDVKQVIVFEVFSAGVKKAGSVAMEKSQVALLALQVIQVSWIEGNCILPFYSF